MSERGPRIVLGADHGGYLLKEEVRRLLEEMGVPYEDLGTHSAESVDYPDYARAVAERILAGEAELGILVCGTGIGMSIAANKVPGIRAALCGDVYSARMSRQHNDANVLCLGGRVLGPELAREIVRAWLGASFEGGRHARRLAKIQALEAGMREGGR